MTNEALFARRGLFKASYVVVRKIEVAGDDDGVLFLCGTYLCVMRRIARVYFSVLIYAQVF